MPGGLRISAVWVQLIISLAMLVLIAYMYLKSGETSHYDEKFEHVEGRITRVERDLQAHEERDLDSQKAYNATVDVIKESIHKIGVEQGKAATALDYLKKAIDKL